MELGEKIKQARLEAGLSQKQLCGNVITRNMLSQIEHGSACPSLPTLRYLASQLGKNISYFLEEDALLSPNQQLMTQIRQKFDDGDPEAVLELYKSYQAPDDTFDWEIRWILNVAYLDAAEKALALGQTEYARRLLESCNPEDSHAQNLKRRRSLLLGQIPDCPASELCKDLPSLDAELVLRARAALDSGNPQRAGHLLDAAEDHSSPFLHLLRGKSYLDNKQWKEAIEHFEKVEASFPKQSYTGLEICCKELQNYEKAYFYACKLRDIP